MRRLKRAAAVIVSIVLVVGAAVGVAAWRRWREVVLERSESKTRAAELRTKTSLTLDEACWIAKDWYHHGKGLAGFRPLVVCEGSVEPLPGGLKLDRVLTESELLQGRHVHSLCLVNANGWEVLGDAYQFDECRSLPKGDAKTVVSALRTEVSETVHRARGQVARALETLLLAPESCPAGLVVEPEQLAFVDASRVMTEQSFGALVPHSPEWSLCDPGDGGVLDEGLAAFVCGRRPKWTHALVHQLTLDAPVIRDEGQFTGGRVTGTVALVDLSKAQAVCRTSVEARLPERVFGRRGVMGAELSSAFGDLVRTTLDDAKKRLLAH